jgi:hypothetical protein
MRQNLSEDGHAKVFEALELGGALERVDGPSSAQFCYLDLDLNERAATARERGA